MSKKLIRASAVLNGVIKNKGDIIKARGDAIKWLAFKEGETAKALDELRKINENYRSNENELAQVFHLFSADELQYLSTAGTWNDDKLRAVVNERETRIQLLTREIASINNIIVRVNHILSTRCNQLDGVKALHEALVATINAYCQSSSSFGFNTDA